MQSYFAEQQAFFVPLLPPAPDLLLYQPGLPTILPFDWEHFPPVFNKALSFEYENSVPVYPVTIVEDFSTRETIFLNAKDESIFVLPPPKDYDPSLFLRLQFPTLYSGRYSHEQLVLWQSLYDPARIRIRVRLLPLEYVEPYLYVAERLTEEAALSAASRADSGFALLRFGDAESNIVFVTVSRTNGGNRMVIGYPDAFTNRLDVFTCNNLMEYIWTFAVEGLSTSGTNRITWVDTNYWVAAGPPLRFYSAGNADVDSDSDGFSDAAETMVYKTDPGDSNSRPVNVSGTISYAGIETGTIYVLSARSADNWSIAGSASLPGPGAWSNNIGVNQSFWFRAFRDVNANFLREAWEPWGLYDDDSMLITGNMTGVNITLQDQPSVWGTLSYTGTVNGDIRVIAVTEPNSWDTTHGCTIGWMSEGISGEVYYVEFPVGYSVTDLPASNYWLRAFVDSNTNGVMDWPELTGQYGDTAIAVSNRRTGVDFSLQGPPTVSGTISYQTYSGGQTGPIYVLAVATSNSCATNHSAVLSAPAQYQLSDLPLGYYWLWAWRDSDGNKTCGVYEARGYYTNHAVLVTGQLGNVNTTMADPDTDGDGMGDWWEVGYFGNLNQTNSGDYDIDNLANRYEYYAGTDPTAGFVDSDGDGMSDDWEYWYGLNPNAPSDANLDMDHDGWTNLEEYNAATDPTAPTSHPGSCWYVATNGVDQASSGDYTNPLASISFAMERASSGHRIIILPGTYAGSTNRDVSFGGKNLMVTGLQGQQNDTTIDCQSSGRAFLIQNGETNVVIQQLTIRNGVAPYWAPHGGAVMANSVLLALDLHDCHFTDNSAPYSGYGGAVYISNGATSRIQRCVFEGNTASQGGGAWFDQPTLVTHSIFQSNSSAYGSAIWASSTVRVEHSFLNGNGGGYQNAGSTIHSSGGHLALLNCTIIGDHANLYSALVRLNGNTAGFTNCILQRFGPYTENMVTGAGMWGASYCCVYGNDAVDGVGNFVADPLFRPNDWRLMPSSPGRDAGTNLSWFGSEVDLDGMPRIQGGTVDIGAYEVGIHYVAQNNPSPSWPFLNWASAATNIQDAIDAASPYSLVLVTNGIYDTGCRVVGNGVMCRVALTNAGVIVQSMNGADATLITGTGPRGTGAIRCVYVGSNVVLDGFTLTEGHTHESGISLAQDGGGAWCEEDAQLINSVLANCSARFGGGVYGGRVGTSIIQSNIATSGGGLYGGFAEQTVLRNNNATENGGGAFGAHLRSCLILFNEATVGGGVCTSIVENCTICDNNADQSGGTCDGVVINSIVYYNNPSNWVRGTFTNSCTTPLPDGSGNIVSEPGFSDHSNGDYDIGADSYCRDAGVTLGWMSNAYDVVGRARVNGAPDMGAYEGIGFRARHMPSYDQRDTWGVTAVGATTRIWVATFDLYTNQLPLLCWFRFGDGQQSPTLTVSSAAAARYIGTSHAYSTASVYEVSAFVRDNSGFAVTQAFLVACRESNDFDARVLHAVEDGLIWLYTNAISHSNGYYWTHDSHSDYVASANGMALTAFSAFGHDASQRYVVYSEVIQKGLDYLLTTCLGTSPISTNRCRYNPDSNTNGLGISIANVTNNEMYEIGSVMTALVGVGSPAASAPASAPSNICNRSYLNVVQDMVDYCGWAQKDDGDGRGGWRYWANHPASSDNSVSWWPAVGLHHAQRWEGITIPIGLRDELALWIAYSQNANGSFGYEHSSDNINAARTSYGLAQLAFLNRPFTNVEVQAALGYLNTSSIPGTSDLYAMHAFGAACDMFDPPIEMIGTQSWRYACASQLLPAQQADGCWSGNWSGGSIGRVFGTASAISILAETAPRRIIVLNVGRNPPYVYSNNTVHVHAAVLPRADVTNLALHTWYRVGTNIAFSSLSMTNSADTYYTATPIPAQPSQTKVEYFLLADYSQGGSVVTQRYPSAYSDHCFSYSVQ